MKIIKKEDEKNIMYYGALQPGDCFQLPNNEDLYLKTSDCDFFVRLCDGKAINNIHFENRLVKLIDNIELFYS